MASLHRPAVWLARRPGLCMALALAAAAIALAPLVTYALGADAPGWSHWLCSPAALRSAAHAVGGGGLRALEAHWPHFLPILIGLGTLAYLWRADRRYHAPSGSAQSSSGVSAITSSSVRSGAPRCLR